MNEACHTCHTYDGCISHMSHVWMRHATHVIYMNEAYPTYEWGMSHIWTRLVTHMNEACRTYEWSTSHTWMRHVAHMHAACDTHGLSPPKRRQCRRCRKRAQAHTHIYTCIHIYIYTHMYTYTYMYTYIPGSSPPKQRRRTRCRQRAPALQGARHVSWAQDAAHSRKISRAPVRADWDVRHPCVLARLQARHALGVSLRAPRCLAEFLKSQLYSHFTEQSQQGTDFWEISPDIKACRALASDKSCRLRLGKKVEYDFSKESSLLDLTCQIIRELTVEKFHQCLCVQRILNGPLALHAVSLYLVWGGYN